MRGSQRQAFHLVHLGHKDSQIRHKHNLKLYKERSVERLVSLFLGAFRKE